MSNLDQQTLYDYAIKLPCIIAYYSIIGIFFYERLIVILKQVLVQTEYALLFSKSCRGACEFRVPPVAANSTKEALRPLSVSGYAVF